MGVVAHAFKTASEKQKEVVLCEFPASLSYIERGKKMHLSVCLCVCARVSVCEWWSEDNLWNNSFPAPSGFGNPTRVITLEKPAPLSGEPSRRLSQDFLNCEMGTPPVSPALPALPVSSEFLFWLREYFPQVVTPHAFLPRPGQPGGPLKRWDELHRRSRSRLSVLSPPSSCARR